MDDTDSQRQPERLGRYRIVRELGRGAMGVVYEGEDPVIGRRVAIKTARRDVLESSGRAEELMARFLREARAAGALNHPNIITIYDANEEGGIAYIAMEYVDSGTLQDVMAGKRRIGPEDAVRIGASVCQALAVAHDRGVIHRDIKPANIMMLADGTVKVADFGIAHVSDSSLTQEGAMIGTPHFMSPEQFMGQKLDGRSDLFSVGVIMYELLTGERPFSGEALSTVMHQVIKVNPVEPKELNYAVNDALSQVVMKALAKRPADRYRTAQAMAAALLESLKENPDPAVLGLAQGNEDTDATLLAGNGQATVVARPRPDEAATVATAAPGLGDQPDALPTETTVSKRKPGLVWPAAAAGAVVVVVIVAAALFLPRGGGSASQPGTNSTGGVSASGQSPGTTSPEGEPAAAAGPSIARLAVTVWYADTDEAWRVATDSGIRDPRKFASQCKPGQADVVIRDSQSGAVLAESQGVSDDVVSLSRPSAKVTATFRSAGYEERVLSYTAQKAGETLPVDVALRRK